MRGIPNLNAIAAVLREPRGRLQIERVDLDGPQENEVLIRVRACGICHTDIACRDAVVPLPLPVVLGHEGAGIIEQVGGAVSDLVEGDHVLLSFGYCGQCRYCDDGLPPYCDHFTDRNFGGTRPDGSSALSDHAGPIHSHFFGQSAFATYAIVNRRNVVRVRRDLPLDALAPLGCSVQTGAGAVLNYLKAPATSPLVVLGVGAVGLSAIMAARIAGCERIVAVDRVSARLALARELGATDTVLAGCEPVAEVIRETVGPVGSAIDTTGDLTAIAACVPALKRQGTLVMLGLYRPGAQLPVDARFIVRNGLTLRGMVEGDSQPHHSIPTLVEHFEAGRLPIDRLIRRYPLTGVNEALKDAESGIAIKPVLIPSHP